MSNIDSLYRELYRGHYAFLLPLGCIILRVEGMFGMLALLGLVLACIYILYYSLILYRSLPNRVPSIPFWMGTFLVAGGSIADMFITVLYSPDLVREGNYMVLMLLDMNATLWFIYLYMLFIQIIFTILALSLWACFLKTYPNRLHRIPYKNLRTTFKWCIGAGEGGMLNWFLLKKVDPYFSLSLMSVMLVVMQFFHWYAVLEWIEIIPISNSSRSVALISVACISTLIFITFTHFKLKQRSFVSVRI